MTPSPTPRWYRALLRLLPFEFRADYGDQMTEAFEDERRDVAPRGRVPRLSFWWRTLVDFARTAPRQHGDLLAQDLRGGLRMLRHQPGFAAAAVLTMALGIGAATTVFTLVDAVVLRPLPYPDAERLVYVANNELPRRGAAQRFGGVMSYHQFRLLQAHCRAFGSVGLMDQGLKSLRTTSGRTVSSLLGSASLFRVVGARPLHGRLLTAADEAPSAPPTAVLTYPGWVKQFGADPNVIGQTLLRERDDRLEPVTIVGVLAKASPFPAPVYSLEPDAWVPFDQALVDSEGWESHNEFGFMFLGFGKLADGVSVETTQRQLDRFVKAYVAEYLPRPATGAAEGMRVKGLREELAGPTGQTLMLFLSAVCLFLLIACVNVGSLLLARASARRQEFAVRCSLGAGRLRVARQLFTESLLLASLGAVLGFGLGGLGTRLFLAIGPKLPRGNEVAVDWRVGAFALAALLLAVLVTGLAPAVQSSRRTVVGGLKNVALPGSRGTSWRRPLWMLLTVQLALTLVLLAGSGVMVNSLVRLITFPLGFDPRSVVVLDYQQPRRPDNGWRAAAAEERRTGVAVLSDARRQAVAEDEEIVRRVATTPGVQSVAIVSNAPLGEGRYSSGIDIEGREPSLPSLSVETRSISPGYFSTLGLRLIRGRAITSRDREGATRVAVINEAMARSAWPGQDPIGKRIRRNSVTVVGVVSDARSHGAREDVAPEEYLSFLQSPLGSSLVVRVEPGMTSVEQQLAAALKAVDPGIQVRRFLRLEEEGARLRARERFATALLATFAALALALALVGVHGVVSYLVQQRRREMGIRMALGAAPGRVVREVVGETLPYAFAGGLIGLGLAWRGSGLLQSLVFGVTTTDPATLIAVTCLLIATVTATAYRPARRAAHTDPLSTLREE